MTLAERILTMRRYPPELAWTCHDYAGCLLQRASTSSARTDTGDRVKAMSLLDDCLCISRELGMRSLMERVMKDWTG